MYVRNIAIPCKNKEERRTGGNNSWRKESHAILRFLFIKAKIDRRASDRNVHDNVRVSLTCNYNN